MDELLAGGSKANSNTNDAASTDSMALDDSTEMGAAT